MFKHIILFIGLSVLAIFFKKQLERVLNGLVYLHNKVSDSLTIIFSNTPTGKMVQDIIALIILPIAAGGLVALVFWFVKKLKMPHIILTIWIMWTVLLVTLLAAQSA